MIDTIEFKNPKRTTFPTYRGKNGAAQAQGVEVLSTSIDAVMLSPLNSRGVTEACWIEIPVECIPELIALLQKHLKQ